MGGREGRVGPNRRLGLIPQHPGTAGIPLIPGFPQLGEDPKSDIDIRFEGQDRKIDEMHRILIALEHRLSNSLGCDAIVADHNPTGLPNSEDSEEGV